MGNVKIADVRFTENLSKMLINKSKNFWKIMRPADYILILILLIFSVILTILLNKDSSTQKVQIYINDKLEYEFPITDDRKIELSGIGTVEIKDGKYRIINSTCENHLCEKQGWNSNLPVICVPNKIAIVSHSAKNKMLITK